MKKISHTHTHTHHTLTHTQKNKYRLSRKKYRHLETNIDILKQISTPLETNIDTSFQTKIHILFRPWLKRQYYNYRNNPSQSCLPSSSSQSSAHSCCTSCSCCFLLAWETWTSWQDQWQKKRKDFLTLVHRMISTRCDFMWEATI